MVSEITSSHQSTLSSFETALMHMEHLPPATRQITRQPAFRDSNIADEMRSRLNRSADPENKLCYSSSFAVAPYLHYQDEKG